MQHWLNKNRIGLNIGGGGGFNSVPFVKLTDGTDSSLSFGGGTLVQIEFGHEFNGHFDLAFDIGGQFSTLDKTINNGSVEFDRSVMSLTPSYILPIGSGDKMSLKFGAGIDLLYNADLNFDLSKVPGGVQDDWKYNATVGEHLNIVYEVNLNRRFSFSTALKWHNANYTYKSTGGKSFPTE